jgi:adenosylcobyric acid synthase
MPAHGALLVAGTGSDVGKTTLVAGLCRLLRRAGVAVAPFKAQNMSLNSCVTADGAEIARAQALQAQAAGVEAEAAMNPVLLKPGSDTRSHLIVLGQPAGEVGSEAYQEVRRSLLGTVMQAYESLRQRFDVVVCEGAGSPAEINLREGDIANLGFAAAAGIPVLLAGDIDRGGVLASLAGTLVLLSPADQQLIRGYVVNKFRGDQQLLQPGLDVLHDRLGLRCYGVLPYLPWLRLDAEDALATPAWPEPGEPAGAEMLRIAVIKFPYASNLTDIDPLGAEPGVIVRLTTRPSELADADLVVLPGTRATVADLRWLRDRGFEPTLRDRGAAGLPVLGICGGYQMLGEHIEDGVESEEIAVAGLGLLPARTRFQPVKVLARQSRQLGCAGVTGYQIHHGQVRPHGGQPFFADEGCQVGAAAGTTWHGLFESDEFRRSYLTTVAAQAGRRFTAAQATCFAAIRERQLDRLADELAEHLDVAGIEQIISGPHQPRPAVEFRLAKSGRVG